MFVRVLAARGLELTAVLAAAAAGFATGGLDAAVLAAVVGFFAAKTLDSLRRALA